MEPDDVPLPPLPEDEKPHAEECQKLYRTMKPGMLNALFLFCRYQDSYDHYKSVRNYFARFLQMGFAYYTDGDHKPTPTSKARCLYRIMVCAEIEDINQQAEANQMRNEVNEFFNAHGVELAPDNGGLGAGPRVLITPPPNTPPPVIEAVLAEYNSVVPKLEMAEKSKDTNPTEWCEWYSLREQKRALESVLGAYKYMLDWCPERKQFTVYLDK